MKKLLLATIGLGLTGILASCGTTISGDAIATINQVKTEYRLNSASGRYVACDNLITAGVSAPAKTQVGVYFDVSGTIKSVDIGLRGNTNQNFDGNYNKNVTASELSNIGGNSFKVVFDANPGEGGFLPQSIIVSPAPRTVKVVSASNPVGGFHADLTLNTTAGSGTATSRYLAEDGNIPVYSTCTVTSTTTEKL